MTEKYDRQKYYYTLTIPSSLHAMLLADVGIKSNANIIRIRKI